ncbi:MAG: carboxymuconolactone decarboxylase family protein [Gemmatimonadales bacterium]
MGHLPSLPEPTHLRDVLSRFPAGWPELLAAHDVILRGAGSLAPSARELLAAHVSGLNGCAFCQAAHAVHAEALGIAPEVIAQLAGHQGGADLGERWPPMLAYVRALTLSPATVDRELVAAVLDAGWDEGALHDATMVVALFSFMNRVVLGFGVDPHAAEYARRLQAVRRRPLAERRAADDTAVGTRPYHAFGRTAGP